MTLPPIHQGASAGRDPDRLDLDEPLRLTAVVHGSVQGVGFRWWTRSQALRLGLTGTVQNREDGSVEVRARGSTDAVSALRALLKEGPPGAEVEQVEEEALADVPTDDFRIVR